MRLNHHLYVDARRLVNVIGHALHRILFGCNRQRILSLTNSKISGDLRKDWAVFWRDSYKSSRSFDLHERVFG